MRCLLASTRYRSTRPATRARVSKTVQTSTPMFLGSTAMGSARTATGGGLTNESRPPDGAMRWVRARYAAADVYMCPGLVGYACAPSHRSSASGRRGTSAVSTTTRIQKTAARAQYSAGRENPSAAALRRRTINAAYDMRYERPQGEQPHASPAHDARRRGCGSTVTGTLHDFGAEDQPIPQAALPGAPRGNSRRQQAARHRQGD